MRGYCNRYLWILIILDIIDVLVPAGSPAGSILCEHSELIFAAGGQTVHTRLGVLVRLQCNIAFICIELVSDCQLLTFVLGNCVHSSSVLCLYSTT